MKLFAPVLLYVSLFSCHVLWTSETEKDQKHDDVVHQKPSRKKTHTKFRLFSRNQSTSHLTQNEGDTPRYELDPACESARYMPHPDVESLAKTLFHVLKTKKTTSDKQAEYAEDIQKYEQAFFYISDQGDTQLSKEEKKKLCEMQKLERHLFGAMLDEERRKGQEYNRQQQEYLKQQQQVHHQASIIEQLTQDKRTQQELVQQLITQHKENTQLMKFGMAAVVCVSALSTVYAFSQGKLSAKG